MAVAKRTITPIIGLQAATLVVTTGVAIAWTAIEYQSWHSQVEVPQRTIRDVGNHIHDLFAVDPKHHAEHAMG